MFRQTGRSVLRNTAHGLVVAGSFRRSPRGVRYNSGGPAGNNSNLPLILGAGVAAGIGYWWYKKDHQKPKTHKSEHPIYDVNGKKVGDVEEIWSEAPNPELVWNEVFQRAEEVLGKDNAKKLRKAAEQDYKEWKSQEQQAKKGFKLVREEAEHEKKRAERDFKREIKDFKSSTKAAGHAAEQEANGYDTYNEIFDAVNGVLSPEQAKDLEVKVNQKLAQGTQQYQSSSADASQQAQQYWSKNGTQGSDYRKH